MGRSKRAKRKRTKPPRVKRMKRAGRLQSARSWLATYQGSNLLRGYCKHFGVDWRCAAIELQALGVQIDKTYLQQREVTERNQRESRARDRERKRAEEELAHRLTMAEITHGIELLYYP